MYRMPKGFHTIVKECHDCGQTGPEWCSMNHGVLLCDECCSIHLGLGRHVSQIKSFKRSSWSPAQLNLIKELSSNGANLIWEYAFRDPQNRSSRKKPSIKDPLPIKADFIRNKYQYMTYINRLKDESTEMLEDLNLQLHSIVRTDNVVTCLRFLSQGADPNFRNPETGTSSIHVAATRGQYNQIELLCIYGGDPALVDASGVSPEEYARGNGYSDLADRLIELQYELTDRLICFLGGKRPDHTTPEHLFLPEVYDNPSKPSLVLVARPKLQQLPDSLFDDLAMDVFDEVERRELKNIWYTQVERTLFPLHVVPFLPVNPSFSATRNQGRQKLARYELKEFQTFIIDILHEVRRRYYDFNQLSSETKFHMLPQRNKHSPPTFSQSEDEPFYDKVASDEDLLILNNKTSDNRVKIQRKSKKWKKDQSAHGLSESSIENTNSMDISGQETNQPDFQSRIVNTELQVKYLACAHLDLKNELSVLHQMIQRLLDESLLNRVEQQVSKPTLANGTMDQVNFEIEDFSRKSSPFIGSDYDNTTLIEELEASLLQTSRATFNNQDKRLSRSMQRFPQIEEDRSLPSSFITLSPQIPHRTTPVNLNRSRSCSGGRNRTVSPSVSLRKDILHAKERLRACESNSIEKTKEIEKRTEEITNHVTELFHLIQHKQVDRYGRCAEQIHHAVQHMLDSSEGMLFNDDIRANLEMLNNSTQSLLTHTSHPRMQIQLMIDDCYSIALATRNLLSLYQNIWTNACLP